MSRLEKRLSRGLGVGLDYVVQKISQVIPILTSYL